MGLWTVRKTLYKLGVLGQHIGFLLFVVGFSTPFWFYASPDEGSQGLWQYCNGLCHELEVEEEWFEAVRALLCVTLIVYLVSCVLAVYDNCLTKYDPLTYTPSRRIEISTAIAGLLGASGIAVYTVMMKMQYHEYRKNYFGGAYAITVAGCGLALLTAIIMSATGSSLNQDCVLISPGQAYVVTYQSTSPHSENPPIRRVAGPAPVPNATLYPSVLSPALTPSYLPKPHAATPHAYPSLSAASDPFPEYSRPGVSYPAYSNAYPAPHSHVAPSLQPSAPPPSYSG